LRVLKKKCYLKEAHNTSIRMKAQKLFQNFKLLMKFCSSYCFDCHQKKIIMPLNFRFLVISLLMLFFPIYLFSKCPEDEVVLIINGREITKSEFLYSYRKTQNTPGQMNIDEYLDDFINFHLKVAYARDEGLDRDFSFWREKVEHRKRHAVQYLYQTEKTEEYAMEAYNRMKYDMNVSHILINIDANASPHDTLKAWTRAIGIRNEILAGESFEKLAVAFSDDPHVKMNLGKIGYISAFQAAYPFEIAIHKLDIDVVSMPVRTRFGYHIIKVNEIRESIGDNELAHIMIGFNRFNENKAQQIVHMIHDSLSSGSDFGELAQKYSTDYITSGNKGRMPWLLSHESRAQEIKNIIYDLQNIGDYTEPIRTDYGWHIFKLLDRRNLPEYETIRTELIKKILETEDKRSREIINVYAQKLKKEWTFTENKDALKPIYNIMDNRIFEGTWIIPQGGYFEDVLFSIDGHSVKQIDFVEYIDDNVGKRNQIPLVELINTLYDEFVKIRLINYETLKLEEKYPDFRYLMQEFTDAKLAFSVINREILSQEPFDDEVLIDFYNRNQFRYAQNKVHASIISANNEQAIKFIHRRAVRNKNRLKKGNDWVTSQSKRKSQATPINVNTNIFTQGDNYVIDNIIWNESVSDILYLDGQFHIVLLHQILNPEFQTYYDSKNQIINDYRTYLEDRLITALKEKYRIELIHDTFSSIKENMQAY
jgi:peptidyl-prolyl cis-trans isomerase SurA